VPQLPQAPTSLSEAGKAAGEEVDVSKFADEDVEEDPTPAAHSVPKPQQVSVHPAQPAVAPQPSSQFRASGGPLAHRRLESVCLSVIRAAARL
jgi:hypothetical protein